MLLVVDLYTQERFVYPCACYKRRSLPEYPFVFSSSNLLLFGYPIKDPNSSIWPLLHCHWWVYLILLGTFTGLDCSGLILEKGLES